jgi:hypothetical protein
MFEGGSGCYAVQYKTLRTLVAISILGMCNYAEDIYIYRRWLHDLYRYMRITDYLCGLTNGDISTCLYILNFDTVKLSLCFNSAPRHEGMLKEWKYSSTTS